MVLVTSGLGESLLAETEMWKGNIHCLQRKHTLQCMWEDCVGVNLCIHTLVLCLCVCSQVGACTRQAGRFIFLCAIASPAPTADAHTVLCVLLKSHLSPLWDLTQVNLSINVCVTQPVSCLWLSNCCIFRSHLLSWLIFGGVCIYSDVYISVYQQLFLLLVSMSWVEFYKVHKNSCG